MCCLNCVCISHTHTRHLPCCSMCDSYLLRGVLHAGGVLLLIADVALGGQLVRN